MYLHKGGSWWFAKILSLLTYLYELVILTGPHPVKFSTSDAEPFLSCQGNGWEEGLLSVRTLKKLMQARQDGAVGRFVSQYDTLITEQRRY